MYALENPIKEYAWGSRTAIAELLGRPSPSPVPQAELWMGAHHGGASRVLGRPLPELITEAPEVMLGPRVLGSFGAQLPFLLKVLAAAEPLSLQAHPTRAQAEAGFAADEAAGISLDAAHRNYKDRHHKPELICALGPFDALCGFREVAETLELFVELEVRELGPLVEELKAAPDARGLRRAFTWLMDPARDAQALAAAAVDACERASEASPHRREHLMAMRLARKYPGDIGSVSALLLNLIRLRRYEAMFLPAGNLHAYLEGVGVEIMASSDNVLRGGLTPKHVDVAELIRVLDFTPLRPRAIDPRETRGEFVYDTPANEFALSRIELDGRRTWSGTPTGPEIVLCTLGELRVDGAAKVTVRGGGSVFVPGSTASYSLSGKGVAFRAAVPDRRA